MPPSVEAFVGDALGLQPVSATQVIARDRHGEPITAHQIRDILEEKLGEDTRVIDARARRELDSMVGELVARSGSYEARTEEIRQRAEASLRHPVSMGQCEAGRVGQSH